MYYQHACAAKGDYGNKARHLYARSMQRASVNIYRTDHSFEMLVFAPGRIKEHFSLDVKGNQLTVSYQPPQDFPRPDWVLREYSRGGFSRTITLNDSIDASKITARYVDGVLEVSLPLLTDREHVSHKITIG
ncbi:MAG: Hsp20/alpha crystallin family protein [Chitinophagaceae bacterium]|nr:Hsp20/alpha crystallin family protein [Chitinophagaceae bacterium]